MGGVVSQTWARVSSLRRDSKYPGYAPNVARCNLTGRRQEGARQDGLSRDRDVRTFKSVKLPPHVGNRNSEIRVSGNFSVSQRPGRICRPDMVLGGAS